MPEHHGEKDIPSGLGMKTRITPVLEKDYESIAFRTCESLKVKRNNMTCGMDIRPGWLT